jgi:hypothetical protein
MPQAPRYTAWRVAGIALMVAAIISTYVLSVGGWHIGTESKLLFWILVALFPILAAPGAFLSWRGRQYAAQVSAEGILTDAKPHVLYLRPFRSDETTRKQVLGPQLTTTEEEQLADVLRLSGELVAIGRPGESLPTPGAARIYVSDEEWKNVVKRRLGRLAGSQNNNEMTVPEVLKRTTWRVSTRRGRADTTLCRWPATARRCYSSPCLVTVASLSDAITREATHGAG